jgi:hypothetical protein
VSRARPRKKELWLKYPLKMSTVCDEEMKRWTTLAGLGRKAHMSALKLVEDGLVVKIAHIAL